MEDSSAFKYNYQYPVFWKRSVFYLAGRSTLSELNRATGGSLAGRNTTVEAPAGPVSGNSVPLQRAGLYRSQSRQVSASLRTKASGTTTSTTRPALRDGREPHPDRRRRFRTRSPSGPRWRARRTGRVGLPAPAG